MKSLFICCLLLVGNFSMYSQLRNAPGLKEPITLGLQEYKSLPHQSFRVDEDGMILIYNYVDERALSNKDSILKDGRKLAITVANTALNWFNQFGNVNIDNSNVGNCYLNRYFPGYKNSYIFNINTDGKTINHIDVVQDPIRPICYLDAELYNQVLKYKVLPNQYVSAHPTERNTLCLLNIVDNINLDRSVESKQLFEKFIKAIRPIKHYTKIAIVYEYKYDNIKRKEYSYAIN